MPLQLIGVHACKQAQRCNLPTHPPCAAATALQSEHVKAHFADQPYVRFRRVQETSFSCVDARGDEQLQGTPGVDMAEVIAGVLAWFKWKG